MHKSEYYCDHCGKRLNADKDRIETAVGFEGDEVDADLCRDCSEELRRLIDEFVHYEYDDLAR